VKGPLWQRGKHGDDDVDGDDDVHDDNWTSTAKTNGNG